MIYPEYHIKTTFFEGPLDLLLQLIEKKKMYIGDVALAEVTDQFLNYVRGTQGYSLAQASHFISVAATLLLIKSRSLLPNLVLQPEEEDEIKTLEQRLKIYRLFRDRAEMVRRRFQHRLIFFKTHITQRVCPVFLPERSISVNEMHSALRRVIDTLPEDTTEAAATIKPAKSLEEVIEDITRRIRTARSGTLAAMTADTGADRVCIIVSFLAILELVRQGTIIARQNEEDNDIIFEALP